MLEPEEAPKKGRPTKGRPTKGRPRKKQTENGTKHDEDIDASVTSEKRHGPVGSRDSPTLKQRRAIIAKQTYLRYSIDVLDG